MSEHPPAPVTLAALLTVTAERDALMREVARLTFITEEVGDLAKQWHEDSVVLAGLRGEADKVEGLTVNRCATQVEGVLAAAGEVEYRLHPVRAAAVHAQALTRLLAGLAAHAEAIDAGLAAKEAGR